MQPELMRENNRTGFQPFPVVPGRAVHSMLVSAIPMLLRCCNNQHIHHRCPSPRRTQRPTLKTAHLGGAETEQLRAITQAKPALTPILLRVELRLWVDTARDRAQSTSTV